MAQVLPRTATDPLTGTPSLAAELVFVGPGGVSDPGVGSAGEISTTQFSSMVNSSPKSLTTVMGGQVKPGGDDSPGIVLVTVLRSVTVVDMVTVVVVRVGGHLCLPFSRGAPEVVVLEVSPGEYSNTQSSPSSSVSPTSLVTVMGTQLNSGSFSSSAEAVTAVVVVDRRVRVWVVVVVIVITGGQGSSQYHAPPSLSHRVPGRHE